MYTVNGTWCRVFICVKGCWCQKVSAAKGCWCKSFLVNRSSKKLLVEESFGVHKVFRVNGFLLCTKCFGTGARSVLCEKGPKGPSPSDQRRNLHHKFLKHTVMPR